MGHKRSAIVVVSLGLAVVVVAAAARAAVPADGQVTLDRTGGQPRAGEQFVVVATVASVGAQNPFSYVLRISVAPGLQLLAWRNPFQPAVCERSGQTLTCRDRVIGGGISTNLNLTLRAAAAGSYGVSAELTVQEAQDPNPANNSAELTAQVLAASGVTRRGNARANTLTGTAGHDRLYGLGGPDTLRGLAGNDLLDGGTGNDRLEGGAGNDTLLGRAGVNRYAAGAGNDTVRAANGRAEQIACGPGTDTAVLDRADRQTGCERVTRR